MKKKLFSVIEYASFFAVQHNLTGKKHPMGDGVDSLFTPTGRSMSPGAKRFRAEWERQLNSDADQTLEAYFPEEYHD